MEGFEKKAVHNLRVGVHYAFREIASCRKHCPELFYGKFQNPDLAQGLNHEGELNPEIVGVEARQHCPWPLEAEEPAPPCLV